MAKAKAAPREETLAEMRERIFSQLPTVAEEEARRRATPKGELPTRLERAVERKAADAADERRLRAWAKRVKTRDEWTDRCTGRKVKATTAAHPDRAEAHHVAGRADAAVRYDVRNGITLSWATHDRVERHELEIVGTKHFTVKGRRYIDATHRVVFKERG